MMRDGRFTSVKVTKVLSDGVEMKTPLGPMNFDTTGKARDGSGWELILEDPECDHDYYDWRCIHCGKEFPN